MENDTFCELGYTNSDSCLLDFLGSGSVIAIWKVAKWNLDVAFQHCFFSFRSYLGHIYSAE